MKRLILSVPHLIYGLYCQIFLVVTGLTIEKITLEGDCRVFEMEGMGSVKEKILLLDNESMTLQYSAIETRTPLQHHLATMKITSIDEDTCQLDWTTEIDPEIFADAIHQGMLISIDGIKAVI